MFNLISIGERAGSGIPSIFYAWHEQGLPSPVISEQFGPERTVLILPLAKVAIKSGDKKVAIKSGDKSDSAKTAMQKEQIIKYMTDHATVRSSEIATLLGITVSRVKVLLAELQSDGIIVAEGANRNRVYRLKY